MNTKERCYWISAGEGKKVLVTEQTMAMLAQEVKNCLAGNDSEAQIVIDDWKMNSTTQEAMKVRLCVLANILNDSVVDGSVRLSAHGLNMVAEKIGELGKVA